jgi:8-oxo-dGTP diphosphatase
MQYVRVAVHGLIKKNGKFLVLKRSFEDDYMPGYWDLPGGTIKFQENIIDALKREIREEVGVKAKIGKILFCYDFPSGLERHQFIIIYDCEYLSGEVKLNLEDHEEFKWVDLNEVKDLEKIAFLDELCKYLGKSKN